jgi:pimeloyl-ACP methyl ester carboxylesterase
VIDRAVLDTAARKAPFTRGRFEELPDAPRLAHPYFQTEAHSVRVESPDFGPINVHYRQWGSGPPLLLVHGLMTSSYSWRYVLDGLGKKFRLTIPDLPGAGRTDKPACRYGAAALARFVGDFQRATGIVGCRAIGNSLGGYLCMRHALEAPEAFARLVNVHSPGVPDWRIRLLHVALAVPGVARGLAWWIRQSPQRWAHRHVHYHDETLKSLEEAREYGAPLSTVEGSRALVRYLSDTVAPGAMTEFLRALEERRAKGSGFPIPLLLIYSEQDPMVPPSVGDMLSKLLPSVPYKRIADTSHFTHVDSPERLMAEVLPFLEG